MTLGSRLTVHGFVLPSSAMWHGQFMPRIGVLAFVVVALVASTIAAVDPALAADDSVDPAELVDAAFEGLLARSPDPDGRAYWIGQLEAGIDPGAVVAAIGDSPEQRRLLVTRGYRAILEREPDAGGLDHWSNLLIDRFSTRTLYGLLFGSEEYFRRGGASNDGFLTALYDDVLDRAPEAAGLSYWQEVLASGTDRTVVAEAFLGSAEAILQPELSIVVASPDAGSTAPVGAIEVELDRSVVAGASTLVVAVGGRRVPGAITSGSTPNSLRFVAEQGWAGGVSFPAPAVVTVFAYDGSEVNHVDYDFTASGLGGSRSEIMVAFYGHAKTGDLGILGETSPAEALIRLQAQAAPYAASGRPVVPVFELIATLVTASPGADGLYRSRTDEALIRPYLDTIRTADGRLILDIQPGRADVEAEARAYESLLVEPDVGLALDPEWVVGPTETPQGRIGALDAEAINRVSAYLSELVIANDLPDKVLIVHRFRPDMVPNADQVVARPGVVILFHADGEGSPGAKIGDYNTLLPNRFARGIKLFFDEDTRLLAPSEVLALEPQPDFVSYQ